jgi:diaminohydroxyphosphoribosylaminopyrimidine deaminase/5-amino-6-(5-phosphoribosylamino)uracil reductase
MGARRTESGRATREEERWMRRAIALARRGRPHPNPHVGAVVVRGGHVIGEGFHARQGQAHAEVMALRQAGERARGATLVVSLEPCNHQGLTPPCTAAILAAGIRRVIVGARDLDPRARGRGPLRLRRSGIEVKTGVLAAEAAAVNEAYDHCRRTGRPLTELKLAASLDGRLALGNGESRWITGVEARREGHRLRARADAVLVGAGTVRQDDPSLTVRLARGQQPVRVVLSGRLDLPRRARLLRDRKARTWVLTGPRAARSRRAQDLIAHGIEVIAVPNSGGRRGAQPSVRRSSVRRPSGRRSQETVDLAAALEVLAARGIRRLLVEGGGEMATALLRQGLVDRFHLHLAAVILGGEHRGWAGSLGVRRLTQGLRLSEVRVRRLGTDIGIEGSPRARAGK